MCSNVVEDLLGVSPFYFNKQAWCPGKRRVRIRVRPFPVVFVLGLGLEKVTVGTGL